MKESIREGHTTSHWGSYTVATKNGEVTAVRGVQHDPDPSPIGKNYVGILRDANRIRWPMVRRGWLEHGPGSTDRRGKDDFVAVPWDTAFQLIADDLERVRKSYSNEAIFGGSYGWGSAGRFHHAQSQVHRFLNTIGGYTRSVNTYSHAAEEVILPHLIGDRPWFQRYVPRWSEVAEHGEFVLAFGGLPRRSVQINPGGVGAHTNGQWQDQCAAAGVEFTVVTPTRSDTAETLNASWVPIRPNTDVALMLGMCHTLLESNDYDTYFVEHCCVGFEKVSAYLLGEDDGVIKNAVWAENITGVPSETIRQLAFRLRSVRSLVSVTWSLQRQHHGEMPYWAGLTLAAMAGSMGKKGGGFGTGYSSMHNSHVQDRQSIAAALPQGSNPVKAFIPVARISDLLLHPGEQFNYNGQTHTYPDIRLVYWIGGNPFHHHQDLNRLVRAWQRPETIIVHEPFWNPLAKFADIVLPAATSLEREDIAIGMGDRWLSYMEPAADPPEGVRSDYENFVEIADRMGLKEEFSESRSAKQWVAELYDRTIEKAGTKGFELPSFEEFKELKAIDLVMDSTGPTAFSELRAAPQRHPLKTPSGRVELYSSTIASFDYADCPGQAVWLEPAEWSGAEIAKKYPLHLISPQPDGKLHSQMDHGVESRRHKVGGRTVAILNTDDATQRGIVQDQVIRIFNDRGACLASAKLSNDLMSGVIQLPTGAWYNPEVPGEVGSLEKHGNPNVLTLDRGTSQLSQGPTSHTTVVEAEPFRDLPPAVTAFERPRVVPFSTDMN